MESTALARYADAIVSEGLRISAGDLLAIHGEPAHRELMVALTAAGYRAGARHVDVLTLDPRVTRARALGAPTDSLDWRPAWEDDRMCSLITENAGIVWLNGSEEPDLLADVPAAAGATRVFERPGIGPYRAAVSAATARFVVAACPTPAWASSIYPERSPEDAVAALWTDLFSFARLEPGDPADGWARHAAMLEQRAASLSERGLRSLRLRDAHTDLRLMLPDGVLWQGGRLRAGPLSYSPNIPTEEVFTSPDPLATEGVFRCSRPLEIDGRVINGIHGSFANGSLTRVDAEREADAEFLRATFARDPGAGRLGEVALVDAASRVGRTGRSYRTTLLDENAASHIAFGFGFGFCRTPGADAPNASGIHIDVMIGTTEMEVTAVDREGVEHAVMAGGEFR